VGRGGLVYTNAVQRSYVLGHNSLMPMEVRVLPHYYYYYYYYYYYHLIRTTPTAATTTTTTNNNNNNSIQFNSLLLMCRVNSKRQLQKQHSVYTT
jgi:hypothetical protein